MSENNQQHALLSKIAAYTEILVKDPGSTIFVSLAETYRKMGMFDDARQIISKGLELHPDFSPAHIVVARVLCQKEDFEDSVAAFEKALELDSESLAALVGYARVRILLGQEDRARDILLRARSLSPADPVINKLLLSLPEEPPASQPVSEEVGAEEEVEEKAQTAEPSPLLSSTLAELYLKQGLKEEALNIYRKLSTQSPDDLSLRRKIKELENGFEELNEGYFSPEPSVTTDGEQPEVTVEEDRQIPREETLSDINESPEEGLPSAAVADEDPAGEHVLETLNQWLSNIKRRRGDV